jgi:hypothetical protein
METTAQSLEQDVEDPDHPKAPSPSDVQPKADVGKEVILVTSSGGSPLKPVDM